MDTNEPGREPTEPTDAELLTALATQYHEDVSPKYPDKIWARIEAAVTRGDEYLSGQRPMPDTPAPDEVAQLHGGMCPQIVAGNFIVQCNGIVRDKAGVLLFQLEDYAPLTARVAELEAAMEKIADWHGHWGPYPEKREDWRSMAIVTAREAVPLSAPGKEPTDA